MKSGRNRGNSSGTEITLFRFHMILAVENGLFHLWIAFKQNPVLMANVQKISPSETRDIRDSNNVWWGSTALRQISNVLDKMSASGDKSKHFELLISISKSFPLDFFTFGSAVLAWHRSTPHPQRGSLRRSTLTQFTLKSTFSIHLSLIFFCVASSRSFKIDFRFSAVLCQANRVYNYWKGKLLRWLCEANKANGRKGSCIVDWRMM